LGALYDDELKEFTDPPEELQKKVKFVADAIKNAKHCVVYTGAGISTAAKIPVSFHCHHFIDKCLSLSSLHSLICVFSLSALNSLMHFSLS
jgi:hypothetical protein